MPYRPSCASTRGPRATSRSRWSLSPRRPTGRSTCGTCTWKGCPQASTIRGAWRGPASPWRQPRSSWTHGLGRCATRAGIVRPPPRGLADAVIYELHVGGFTRHPTSGVTRPGTFAGLVEKIPYLKDLGITHVELLPVMAFDEQDVPTGAAVRGLGNYWGYSSYGFYAPHPRYCVDPAEGPREFAECVGALRDAGIGVILDVVFNHTSEGGADGPVIHFKGLANDIFYQLEAADRRRYRDYTGTGDTVNCNHPLVSAFIVRCLEYWVEELGVDGF